MYSHLFVPTDGSKLSDKAVTHAIGLAKATKARMTLFHAIVNVPQPVYADGVSVQMTAPGDYMKLAKARSEKLLARLANKALAAGVQCATAQATTDAPWEAILDAAKKAKADTIVMASHGRRGLAGLLLGSETTKVLTHSKLPVLVVR
jgi:nucleotide-binding universal stress UspA family protein